MKNPPKLLYLILLITLSFSCAENKPSHGEVNDSEVAQPLPIDTTKFTSGVRAIIQDSKGNYWIGSHRQGVCRFDGKSFEYFTTADGLADNQVRSIQEDKNGTIWFGTANGVSSYANNAITNHTVANPSPSLDQENTDNYLWFNAGNETGAYVFDGSSLHYLPFTLPENVDPYGSYAVTGISKAKDGNVWIGTYQALFTFDGKTINLFDESQFGLKEGEQLHIRSVLADSKGRVWIGNNGIGVLLHSGDSTINFSDKEGLMHSNSTKNGNSSPAGTLEHVFTIAEDNDGNIWFGDRDTGAWKYDGETMTNYTVDDKLSSPMVWGICTDQNNSLLFSMANGGVYEFNGTSFDRKF